MLPEVKRGLQSLEKYSIQTTAKLLLDAFAGFDQPGAKPPEQLQWLIRQKYVYPTTTHGVSRFQLSHRIDQKDDPILWGPPRFKGTLQTTQKSTPLSPHLEPADVAYAPTAVTITWWHHHFFGGNIGLDLLVVRNEHDQVKPYLYGAGNSPIEPLELFSWPPLWDLTPSPDHQGAVLQMWQLAPTRKTYELQASLQVYSVPLVEVARALATDPHALPTR